MKRTKIVEPKEEQEEEVQEQDEEAPNTGEGRFDDSRSVFVGRLNKSCSEEDLRSLFHDAGEVTRISLPCHSDSGRPMGIAFVEFADVPSVTKAVRLDGASFMGNEIKIRPASRPKPSKASRPKGKGGRAIAKADDDATVYAGNLSFATDERTVRNEFGRFGKVVRVNLPLWHSTGRKRGFALVEFAAAAAARKAAAAMDGKTVDGRQIEARMYTPQDPKTLRTQREREKLKEEKKEKRRQERMMRTSGEDAAEEAQEKKEEEKEKAPKRPKKEEPTDQP